MLHWSISSYVPSHYLTNGDGEYIDVVIQLVCL